MKLELVRYTCGACDTTFKAPEIPNGAYGDFLLRSETDDMRYLAALTDKTYDEVDRIMLERADIAGKNARERAKILQFIYGPVACDPDGSGNVYKIGRHPKCPSCSGQSISSWEFIEPPDFVNLDILPVTHVSWDGFSSDEKKHAVFAQLDRLAM